MVPYTVLIGNHPGIMYPILPEPVTKLFCNINILIILPDDVTVKTVFTFLYDRQINMIMLLHPFHRVIML